MRFLLFFLVLHLVTISSGQSYQKLHEKSIVIDTHNDVLADVILKGKSIETDLTGQAHSDIARFKRGGVDIQVFSVFCDERFGKDTAFKQANLQIDSLMSIISRHPDKMMLVSNPTELRNAVKQKKLGCMFGLEGGHMIEDRLEYLDQLCRRGVRYMTLTWNNSTSWATSAADEAHSGSPQGGVSQAQFPLNADTSRKWISRLNRSAGLTEFGRAVVKRMNELGMLVDVSHVGEQTFWDVINTTSKPVIASHSSVYAICPLPRNLKDDQIRAIGKNGGVIHVNFYSGFVDSNFNRRKKEFLDHHHSEVDSLRQLKWANYEIEMWAAKVYPLEADNLRPDLSLLIDHIDYIVKLIGVDHVGLGSDFDGIESAPKPLDDVATFPLITKALLERGYSKVDIRKILGGNFIRVFKEVQKGK